METNIWENFRRNPEKVPAPIDGKNVTDDWIYDFDNHVSSNQVGWRNDFAIFLNDKLWKLTYMDGDNTIFIEGMHTTREDAECFKDFLNDDMEFASMNDLECDIQIFGGNLTVSFYFKDF